MNDMKQRDNTTKRPTPETDAFCSKMSNMTKLPDFARKLEQERDEAREIALNLQNIMGMKV